MKLETIKDIDKMTCDEWIAYRREKIDAYHANGFKLLPDPNCGICDMENNYICFQCELLHIDK